MMLWAGQRNREATGFSRLRDSYPKRAVPHFTHGAVSESKSSSRIRSPSMKIRHALYALKNPAEAVRMLDLKYYLINFFIIKIFFTKKI